MVQIQYTYLHTPTQNEESQNEQQTGAHKTKNYNCTSNETWRRRKCLLRQCLASLRNMKQDEQRQAELDGQSFSNLVTSSSFLFFPGIFIFGLAS